MNRIYPGDLVAVNANGRYYYALILDKIKLFGGNWVYAFHAVTEGEIIGAGEIIGSEKAGFHAFVDFIFAKREGRLSLVARKIDTELFNSVHYLKNTHHFVGKAPIWFITDMSFQEVKRVSELTEEEKDYPFPVRIDDTTMIARIEQQWKPNMDPRI